MAEEKVNRKYKDTLFSSLFYSCDNAVENAKALYKALTGKDVQQVQKCRLEDVFFGQFMNDVAYIMDGKFICFIEHQSTINPNMALRLLIYAARTYERFCSGDDIYKSTLIKLPTPEFYVLYNGKTQLYKDGIESKKREFVVPRKTLRLSNAFIGKTDHPKLELEVEVININYGKIGDEKLKDCKILTDYAFVIDKVRRNNGDIKKALDECIADGVLVDYIKQYGSEVINMLFTEYNAERALEIRGQEEYQKGRTEGFLQALIELVKKGLLTRTQAAEQANMTVEEFEIKTANLA